MGYALPAQLNSSKQLFQQSTRWKGHPTKTRIGQQRAPDEKGHWTKSGRALKTKPRPAALATRTQVHQKLISTGVELELGTELRAPFVLRCSPPTVRFWWWRCLKPKSKKKRATPLKSLRLPKGSKGLVEKAIGPMPPREQLEWTNKSDWWTHTQIDTLARYMIKIWVLSLRSAC